MCNDENVTQFIHKYIVKIKIKKYKINQNLLIVTKTAGHCMFFELF